MLRWIVGSSLKAKWFVLVVAVGIMAIGLLRLRDMPREVLPEFTPPTVEVQTEALGLSAAEVEELITVPIEQDLLNGVAFIDTIRSQSIPGLSSIEMVFQPGTDILDARQVVQERLTQAHALPQVSKPPQMLQSVGSTSRVMMIGLSSDEVSLIDMSLLARWNIRPRLMGVEGVANVSVWGQRDRQLQVLVDPARLHANGVSLQQIIETSANAQFVSNLTFVEASTPGTGGIIETPTQRFGVQHAVPFASPDDLAKVIIEGTEDAPLRLGDVADIRIDHQLLIGDAVLSQGPGLLLVVERLPGASALDVTRGVEAALEDLKPGLSGITIDPSLFRPATYIETANHNVAVALIVGALLLMLALGAVLFDPRATVVCVVAVATSLAGAVLVLSLLDITLNSMIVAGLAIAIVVVVDEAVGDVGNLAAALRRRHDGDGSRPAVRAILDASLEMRSAGLIAVLIALVSLVPALFTRGSFGTFFPTTAGAYAAAIVISMLLALVVTPALGLILIPAGVVRTESPLVRWLRPRYERGLRSSLRSATPALIVVAVLLVSGLVALPFLERSVTPTFQDTDLLVQLDGPPGTSLPEMDRVSALMADEIGRIPGVLGVGGHAGRAVLSDQVVGTGGGELWVDMDPDADYGTTRAAIEDVVDGYPGVERQVLTYPSQRIAEVVPETDAPVTVRVFGPDLGILRSKAEEVRSVLSGIDGVVDPRVETQPEEPVLEIEVDLEAAERYGIVPGDVRRAAATLLSGIQVGSLFDEQKVFDVVVWGTPEVRHDLSSVEDLAIDVPGGGQVRLGDVASVQIEPSPSAIRHIDVSRSLDVTAQVSGRDLDAVIGDVERGIDGLVFPIEYHTELVGDFASARAADRRALALVAGAVIAILLLLQAAFRNWRLALAVTLMLPIALAGGAVAALVDGGTVSLGSVAGFFAVLAIATRHSLIQIRQLQRQEGRDGESFGEAQVLLGARDWLAPIVTSLITLTLTLAPMVVAGRIAGLEILHPMAVVVIGGLVSIAPLMLFVLPAIYLRFGAGSAPDLSIVLSDRRTIDLTALERPEVTSS